LTTEAAVKMTVGTTGNECAKRIDRVNRMLTAAYEKARHINECMGCIDGRIEIEVSLEGGTGERVWWPCPCLSTECQYGWELYSQYISRVQHVIAHVGIPKIHIKNFSAPQKTPAFIAADAWDMEGFLIFTGNAATGKSFAASWTAKRYIMECFGRNAWLDPFERDMGAERAQKSVLWTYAYDLAGDPANRDKVKRFPLLLIDGLGMEENSSKTRSFINYAVSARYDEQLPTVMTTHLNATEMRTRYGDGVMNKIMRFGQVVRCTGEISSGGMEGKGGAGKQSTKEGDSTPIVKGGF